MSAARDPTPTLARSRPRDGAGPVATLEAIDGHVGTEPTVAEADAVLGAERRGNERGIVLGDLEGDDADLLIGGGSIVVEEPVHCQPVDRRQTRRATRR